MMRTYKLWPNFESHMIVTIYIYQASCMNTWIKTYFVALCEQSHHLMFKHFILAINLSKAQLTFIDDAIKEFETTWSHVHFYFTIHRYMFKFYCGQLQLSQSLWSTKASRWWCWEVEDFVVTNSPPTHAYWCGPPLNGSYQHGGLLLELVESVRATRCNQCW